MKWPFLVTALLVSGFAQADTKLVDDPSYFNVVFWGSVIVATLLALSERRQ